MRRFLTLMVVATLCGCLVSGQTARRGAQPIVLKCWNETVRSIEEENKLFHQLEDSYRRYRPGGVIVTPELREQLRRERVTAIDRIIALHEARIKTLSRMRGAELEGQ